MQFITGFESARFMPPYKSDILQTSNHLRLFREDLRLVREAGMTMLRYAVPWHRIERRRGKRDWRWMDQAMDALAAYGLDPILDLVHHVSIPPWIRQGFAHPDYPQLQAAFAAAVAERYPQVTRYTPFNEPFVTTLLAGHLGIWYPFGRCDSVFVPMLINVARSICLTSEALRAQNPRMEIIHIDTCEAHHAQRDAPADVHDFVAFCNDRRFLCDDLILGRVDAAHPLFPFLQACGYTEADAAWFAAHRTPVTVRGLDYYAHAERSYFAGGSCAPSPTPRGLAAIVAEYRAHFADLPPAEQPAYWLTETNIRGYSSDRMSWLKYTVEQAEQADLAVFGWFPFIDSTGWGETLLRVPHTRIDPVGIYCLDERREQRYASELSEVYGRLARGELTGAEIPAYEFREPILGQLRGYRPQMGHWHWERAVELPLTG